MRATLRGSTARRTESFAGGPSCKVVLLADIGLGPQQQAFSIWVCSWLVSISVCGPQQVAAARLTPSGMA